VVGPHNPSAARRESAVDTLARGVRVRSKLVSWSMYSWPWILFVLAFIVGNGALMVFEGLDLTGIGIASPLMLIIWHFVMFVIFGALLIWTYVRFGDETLLEDKLRLPFLCANCTLFNFVMTIVVLAWILDNQSAYAEVHFTSNSQAYVSFVAINGVAFVWFYLIVGLILMAWVVHYNQRKYLELIDLALHADDVHLNRLHNTSLRNVVQTLRQQQSPQMMRSSMASPYSASSQSGMMTTT